MSITVRPVTTADAAAWTTLYRGYRAFYALADDDVAVQTTWGWVSRGEHGLLGLVAVDEQDVPVGLAHLRRFARPSTGRTGLYLDDLFTAPEARGAGVATALLHEAAAVAAREGATVVRWITAADNVTARRVYDAVATATPWVTYDMQPAQH
jgi:GNAT superfamily N-acetyltransferase